MTERQHHDLVGKVALFVRDINVCTAFYRDVIGLSILTRGSGLTDLGMRTNQALLTLIENPGGVHTSRTTGLYHMAFLLPSRAALARQLLHFKETGVPLSGMSDHLVSEALYLADPEGNGIEIYRDRHHDEWMWKEGEVEMTTIPLAVDDLLATLADEPGDWKGMPSETVMGHIHLQVSDLDVAERFYGEILGMDVTTRSYPGALFFSKEGYHHHIGANIWRNTGAPAPPADFGLFEYEIRVRTWDEITLIRDRARNAGLEVDQFATEIQMIDPFGINLIISPVLQ